MWCSLSRPDSLRRVAGLRTAEYHDQGLIQSQLTELSFEVVLIDNIRLGLGPVDESPDPIELSSAL